jgi:putative ABC transport system permease protein
MSLLSGWRLALRLAWREVRRSRARSALVLVMVTFPVIAVAAADVAQATSSVSSVESLDRRIGAGAARVQAFPDMTSVDQTADPDSGGIAPRGGGSGGQATLPEIRAALGGTRPVTELRERQIGVRTHAGVLEADATGLDLRDPLTDGLFRPTSGRLPTAADEVDVNAALAGHGFGIGDRLTLTSGATVTIVGTAESTALRTSPIVLGTADSQAVAVGAPGADVRTWLVGGAPIAWAQVRAVNAVGGVVLSRQVVEHPPATSQLPEMFRGYAVDRSQIYAVLALIAVMSLLEVVLLAGPAFAVGARRQSRALALIAANGGNPAQARRVVHGSALVLGTTPSWGSLWPGFSCPCCRGCRPPTSDLSSSAGRTWPPSPCSGSSAPSWPPSYPHGSPRGRTSSRCWPGAGATAPRVDALPSSASSCSGWGCSERFWVPAEAAGSSSSPGRRWCRCSG